MKMNLWKKLLVVLAVVLVLALVPMGTFANKGCSSQVDQTFSEVYEECSNISFDEVTDEYTSYAFLLKNVENVEIQNGLLSFTSDVLSELSESEVDLVYELAEKINTLIELDAIRIDTNLRIWEKAAPSIANVPMPYADEFDLMGRARTNANTLQAVYDNAPFSTKHLVAGSYFAERVKNGGIWDYKVFLGPDTWYYIPELGARMTGETIGNYHYGYVGSVCFGETTLKTAAGFVQILSGTSDISYWNSYFDDPADQRDIQRGIDRYNLEH